MQGAGKGTVGKTVAAQYNLKIFETGGALRELAKEDSELGKKIKTIIEAGNLVQNDVVMEIVEDFISKLEPGQSVLFDGIPRSTEQAESLNMLLSKNSREYKAVLINITKEIALERLTTRKICSKCKTVFPAAYENPTCNQCDGELMTRADDNPEAIKTRLEAYDNETVPAIAIYKDRLISIDGTVPIEEVQKDTINTLASLY